jgi:hypothetical protein
MGDAWDTVYLRSERSIRPLTVDSFSIRGAPAGGEADLE